MNSQETLKFIKQLAKLTETMEIELNENKIHLKFYDVEKFKEVKAALDEAEIKYIDNGSVVATSRGNLIDGLIIKSEDVRRALS